MCIYNTAWLDRNFHCITAIIRYIFMQVLWTMYKQVFKQAVLPEKMRRIWILFVTIECVTLFILQVSFLWRYISEISLYGSYHTANWIELQFLISIYSIYKHCCFSHLLVMIQFNDFSKLKSKLCKFKTDSYLI